MEYCQAGSVSDVMRLCRSTLSDEQIAYVMKDSLKGLMYIHSKKKIHRDIKGANILTTKDGLVKLADFGVATKTSALSDVAVVGSPYWSTSLHRTFSLFLDDTDNSGAGSNRTDWSNSRIRYLERRLHSNRTPRRSSPIP